MNTEKIIRYYTKVIDANRKAYGDDWRTLKYQAVLDKTLELIGRESLTQEEQEFMEARAAMAEVFGKNAG